MIETVFSTVLRMTGAASLAILAVLVLRLLMRKAPKVYSYALWLLVLARLLCPVFPEVSFSPMPAEVTNTGTVLAAPVVTEEAVPSENQAIKETPVQNNVIVQPAQTAPAKASWSLSEILAAVWAAGAAAMLLWGLVSYILLKRKLREAVPMGEDAYLADHIDTPFVMGFLRPKIYLPSDLSAEWVDHILLHERYHIRHADPAVKLLFFLALSLHWFNPLVWMAWLVMGRDMEMRCDEAVMKTLGAPARAEYAQALLCLSTGRRSFSAAPLAFGEGDAKGRIRNVLNYRKPKFWLCALAVVLCVVAAVCLLTNPKTDTVDQLEYPGLEWNMSPEEVKNALGITDEDIVQVTDSPPDEITSYYFYAFTLNEFTCFGQKAKAAGFIFTDHTGTGQYLGLNKIQIFFPDEQDEEPADMDSLRAALTERYGECTQSDTYLRLLSAVREVSVISEGPNCTWLPRVRAGDWMTDDQVDQILQYYQNCYAALEGTSSNVLRYSMEDLERVIRQYPLVTMTCIENASTRYAFPSIADTFRENGGTDYMLLFEAMPLVQLRQFLEHSGAYAWALEYPGFSWGDSPAEVKNTLDNMGINTRILAEYTRDEKRESYADSYGEYSFRIGETEMFGQKAESVEFRFVDFSFTMEDLKLAQIIIYYPDGYEGETTDMDALEAYVTAMYGDPVRELVRRRWYTGSGEIEETRSAVNPNLTAWYSKLTAADILSEAEMEAIYNYEVQYRTENGIADWVPTLEEYKTTLDDPAASVTLRETYYYLMPVGQNEALSEEERAKGLTEYVLELSGLAYLSCLNTGQTLTE